MNTKVVLIVSAAFMGVLGVCFTFLPDEVLLFFKSDNSQGVVLILQLSGAIFIALAMQNWMAKGSIIGGIYNRPLAMSNFLHFLVGSLALLKAVFNYSELPKVIWSITGVYTLLAILFGLILFRHPIKESSN